MDSGGEAEETPVGRRADAQRASRLAAEQLETSLPVRSTDGSGGLTFGEPSARKAPVKVTYKSKGRSSPKKSPPTKNVFTSSSTLPRRRPAPSFGSSTPSPSRPRAKPAAPRGQRKKQSTSKQETAAVEDDDNASLSSLTDIEDTAISDVPPTEPPLSQTTSITTKRKFARTRSSPVTSLRKKTILKRKRSVTPSIHTDSDNDIELLPRAPRPAFQPFSSPPPEIPQATPSSSFNRNGARGAGGRPRAGTLPSRPGRLAATLSLSSLSTLTTDTEVVHPGWDIEDHNLAFVRVDSSGELSESEDGIWWPAEVCWLSPSYNCHESGKPGH